MTWKPHVTVAALAEQDGKFLLVEERVEGRRCLNQPAGHLEQGESLLQAVARETLEETGYRFRPETLVGIYRWRSPADGRTFLRFAFYGQCSERDARRRLDEGIIGPIWLSPDELSARSSEARSPLVLRCIADCLAGCRYPLALLSDLVEGP